MSSQDPKPVEFKGMVIADKYAAIPDGALGPATINFVLQGTGELESRRGLARQLHALRYDKIFTFGTSLILHRESDGLLQQVDAPYGVITRNIGTAPVGVGLRPHAVVLGERWFCTSSEGLKVLDSTTDVLRFAGGVLAPSIAVASATGTTTQWLPNNKRVAYRYVIGRITSTGQQVLGPPSGRRIVENTTGAATDVLLDRVEIGRAHV